MITLLKYGNTNTYLIRALGMYVLFDTDWAGSFEAFCKALGEKGIDAAEIGYILVSHFHPDHMGIAGQIASLGAKIIVFDVQTDYVHASDAIFAREANKCFVPIDDAMVERLTISESRSFLHRIGIEGEVLHTPGHSEDSISLLFDEGSLLVGDLNPLYELELHKGTQIGDTWEKLLKCKPRVIYYGHAKSAVISKDCDEKVKKCAYVEEQRTVLSELHTSENDLHRIVKHIIKYIDKQYDIDKIVKKTGADRTFVMDVSRMYLTHPNVSIQGILDRIEIKNK